MTDVDWQYFHPEGKSGAGQILIFRLWVENLVEVDGGLLVFQSTVTLGDRGEGGGNENMTSGFAVSSEARIGLDVYPGPTGPPSRVHAILRGDLLDAK